MSCTINQVPSEQLNVQLDPAAAAGGAQLVSGGDSASGAVASKPVDQTSLSPLGQLLDSVARSATSMSSFRPDLVAHLRGAIAAGTYQPDPAQVAERVVPALNNSKQGSGS